MHWILVPEPPVPRLSLPIVEDLISSQEFISSENPIDWMKQKLMINEQQIQLPVLPSDKKITACGHQFARID